MITFAGDALRPKVLEQVHNSRTAQAWLPTLASAPLSTGKHLSGSNLTLPETGGEKVRGPPAQVRGQCLTRTSLYR